MEIIPIPAFSDNYIWALCHQGRAAVVDPGDASPVLRFLATEGLALAAILATHHHGDHVGGVAGLLAGCGEVPVYGPAAEAIPVVTRPVADGDQVALPGFDVVFEVIEVPGHTRGHIAYRAGDLLFCGDTLFACGCGRLFEGTPAQMLGSLDRLAALPDSTRVFCAHEYTLSNIRFARAVEPANAALAEREQREAAKRAAHQPTLPATLGEERLTNPFLRSREASVRRAIAHHAGRRPRDDADAFGLLREWKNAF